MRNIRAWMAPLLKELADEAVTSLLGQLKASELCQLELGLTFLADHLPGKGVGALWPVLSGYSIPRPGLEGEIRSLRLLMGDLARSGQFLNVLDRYLQVDVRLRGFDTGQSTRHVRPGTVFTAQSSSYLIGRHDTYRQALKSAVPYAPASVRPAPMGSTVSFTRADGSWESAHLPDWLAADAPLQLADPVASRRRAPFLFTRGELRTIATYVDTLLKDQPHITNRNWAARLATMEFAVPDPSAGTLDDLTEDDRPLALDGILHLVGLMNSGKSTLMDLLTVLAVRRGLRVGYLLASAADVYAKTSFLRALGINAVPQIGRSNRSTHVAAYWRTTLHDHATLLPEYADGAARYTVDMCLLGSLINSEPLEEKERPCRGRMKVAGKRGMQDCPMLSRCPRHHDLHDLASAEVIVTTPAGMLHSKASWSAASMRIIERFQHDLDLLLVDEADEVQRNLDDAFLQQRVLTAPRDGWSTRTRHSIAESLDHRWHLPLNHPDVQRYEELERRHGEARIRLYQLLVDQDGAPLRELLGQGPFSGHTLLRQLARALHGLRDRSEYTKSPEREDLAQDFFDARLQPLASASMALPPADLSPVLEAMTSAHDGAPSPDAAALTWLRRCGAPETLAVEEGCGDSAPSETGDRPEDERRDLAPTDRELQWTRLLQAGIWAARITTTFFEMAKLYPAVNSVLALNVDEEDGFLKDQPPRELMAFVPEQPAGNLMSLEWQPTPTGDSGSLRILWLRGVGRWLLYHLHDLLSPEGVDGPNTVLASATSHAPAAPKYHIDLPIGLVLRTPKPSRAALAASRMFLRPGYTAEGRPVFVSGTGGDPQRRTQALLQNAAALCLPRAGAATDLLAQVRTMLGEGRKQVLFTLLSTRDAETVATYLNLHTSYTARHVVRDGDSPGPYGIARRQVTTFPTTGADILVASEGAIQRGHNLLNNRREAALGAIFYLVRPHPPGDDSSFVLSLLGADAMRRLTDPTDLSLPGTDADALARKLRHGARATWSLFGQPILFSRLAEQRLRDAFAGNQLISTYQTAGRGIRGDVPVLVYLCDAAWAPRTADRNETAPDTVRTSLLVATQHLLDRMLATPGPDASHAERLNHAIRHACWGLAGHLYSTIDMGI
ncbi:hypothetical protein ABZ921_32965 [Streptomyces atriruber]|uniref:pPIWI-RE three-gene island domain-containing protein n=1 Tax=Streptomyces atriruber TaxID=545121 RepID=A0ABV3BWQ1_9ACTN